MAVFYTYKTTMEEEKMTFLKCLYHDIRNGQAIRLRKQGDDVSQYSTFVLHDLAATGTDMANLYTSVNSFKGGKRTSASLFNYCSIFIDIDCHAMDLEGIKEAKRRTVELLEEAYASGKLAEPTMITDTGRGFGLQYVLARSIANIDQTEKQQSFFKRVRKSLFERYRDILSVDPMAAQPDASALDDARVCRLPGTYNQSAGTYCRLIGMSKKYYELSKIVQDCHLWNWVDDEEYRKKKEEKERKRKERIAAGKVIPFGEIRFPFLSARVDQLMKLQDLRGEDCTDDCREQILFIAYSAYVQLDRDTAADKLQKLNTRFTDPLDQAEIDHIVEETDASVGFDHRGFYKLKNSYLVERLNLSEEEIKALGLDMGWQRTAARQSARQGKLEKREKVIELLKQVELLTYDEIAKMMGVSKRKVCTIAKEENLMRYRKAAERHNEKKEDKADIVSIDGVKHVDTDLVAKSAKNAAKSVCVPFVDCFSESLLSTPSAIVNIVQSSALVLDSLQTAAATSVVAAQLFRVTTECRTYPELRPLVDDYFEHAAMQSSLDHIKALDTFARWLIDATYGYGRFSKVSKQKVLANSKTSASTIKKNYKSETLEERRHRIDGYLHRFKDERFEIIDQTEEYQKRIDSEVLRTVKVVFMQVLRLKREYLFVEGEKIPTKEIVEAFKNLTYKDIVILCERMEHKGTLQRATKPFFYVIQAVFKYSHIDAAKAQSERIQEEKKSKQKKDFYNFEQHDFDYEMITMNAIRQIAGLPELTAEEYQKVKQ